MDNTTHFSCSDALALWMLAVMLWLAAATPAVANPLATSAQQALTSERYRFDVYYNNKRIGEHEFQVDRDNTEIRVRSSAKFLVKLLFVPVYKYQHLAEESWHSGCLQSLAATTNDNGDYFEINMKPIGGSLLLSTVAPNPAATALRDPCPASYAYWDLDLLRRGALINSQTGDITDAQLLDRGVEEINGVSARRFTLIAGDTGNVELWYRESDSQWIRLETQRNGGTLAYRTGA